VIIRVQNKDDFKSEKLKMGKNLYHEKMDYREIINS
jgi:hypothetical protein